jgi:hypothetical protein
MTMNRQRNRRSLVGANRARRLRPLHPASQLAHSDRLRPAGPPPASPPEDRAALAFLADILVGDRAWTIAEVRRLISLREAAELGR